MPSKNEIQKACKIIKDGFDKDPDLKKAYIDNIATLLHDNYGLVNYNHLRWPDERKEAAEEILKLIFYS